MNHDTPAKTLTDCWNRIGVRGDRSCDKLVEHTHCRNCDTHREAARAIVQRPLPPGYQEEWSAYFAREESRQAKTDQSALIFRIGAEWLSLPARLAVTVAETARVHTLPHRSGVVLTGVVNVKGRLYPCMSLAGLLSIDVASAPSHLGRRVYPRLLVMQLSQQMFALPVQDLYGIHRYAASSLQEPPSNTNKGVQRYLEGVLNLDEMRVGCLDAELIGSHLAGALK